MTSVFCQILVYFTIVCFTVFVYITLITNVIYISLISYTHTHIWRERKRDRAKRSQRVLVLSKSINLFETWLLNTYKCQTVLQDLEIWQC